MRWKRFASLMAGERNLMASQLSNKGRTLSMVESELRILRENVADSLQRIDHLIAEGRRREHEEELQYERRRARDNV